MSEAYISLYGAKAEAFRRVKEEVGPEGVDMSNADVVMRLIEEFEDEEEEIRGGLTR